jgi:hypothetical protein
VCACVCVCMCVCVDVQLCVRVHVCLPSALGGGGRRLVGCLAPVWHGLLWRSLACRSHTLPVLARMCCVCTVFPRAPRWQVPGYTPIPSPAVVGVLVTDRAVYKPGACHPW